MKSLAAKILPTLIGLALFFYVVKEPHQAGAQVHTLLNFLIHVMTSFASFAGSIS
ncbi:hypothetical protein [Fodinicola feengrottensis]|uniref:hypothetical protein n=1 Tax=Fodinicola feengrottensis TaxID=435914 RepID=UPI0031DF05DD